MCVLGVLVSERGWTRVDGRVSVAVGRFGLRTLPLLLPLDGVVLEDSGDRGFSLSQSTEIIFFFLCVWYLTVPFVSSSLRLSSYRLYPPPLHCLSESTRSLRFRNPGVRVNERIVVTLSLLSLLTEKAPFSSTRDSTKAPEILRLVDGTSVSTFTRGSCSTLDHSPQVAL